MATPPRCAFSGCRKVLVRNSKESHWDFKRRRFCNRACYIQSRHKKHGGSYELYSRECRCPKCGVIHNKAVHYTGPAKYPPYYCQTHQRNADDRRSEYLGVYDPQVRRHVREIFREWDSKLMEEQVTTFSACDYSQEELRALVEECR